MRRHMMRAYEEGINLTNMNSSGSKQKREKSFAKKARVLLTLTGRNFLLFCETKLQVKKYRKKKCSAPRKREINFQCHELALCSTNDSFNTSADNGIQQSSVKRIVWIKHENLEWIDNNAPTNEWLIHDAFA